MAQRKKITSEEAELCLRELHFLIESDKEMSRRKLGLSLNLGGTTPQKWFEQHRWPSRDEASLCEVIGLPLNYFEEVRRRKKGRFAALVNNVVVDLPPDASTNEIVSTLTVKESQIAGVRWVPKVGGHLHAGKQEDVNEIRIDGITLSSAEQIPVPKNLLPKRGDFCAIEVEGNSMEPTIKAGSVVFVDLSERNLEELIGKTVAAFVPDLGTLVKQFKRNQRKDMWTLHSVNPEAEDITVAKDVEGFVVREVISAYTKLK